MTCPKAGRDHRTGDLAAQVLIGRLSAAGPTEFEVEFGIDLAAEAGTVITKSTVGTHAPGQPRPSTCPGSAPAP
ncbi:CU044_2847 family protein [Streptomyces sp. LUP30]|uniref:CU044_2847 family protein n=1 Tax=Streptomyces sp. LUP30 TaxID=1890285 RepID=UPI00159F0068|nr:CU044_2847 family protein [Streptomyces sp. LUP30]